jgi:hypothetical protein
MTADKTAPLRFRMWVDAELVADDVGIVNVDDPDSLWDWVSRLAGKHAAMANFAEAEGARYLIEVEWWDGERTRWGTDVDGMVVPVEVGLHEIAERISERWT